MAKALFCLHTILWINGFPKPNNKKQNKHTVQPKGYHRDLKDIMCSFSLEHIVFRCTTSCDVYTFPTLHTIIVGH